MAAVRHLGFVAHILGPPTLIDYLVVSIVVQNLVEINGLVSII